MRRRIAIPLLLALAALTALAAVATAEIAQKGNLRISFDGSFTPHSLPRDKPAPITVSVAGAIATTDGSHPPALRQLEIALNRNGRISTRGLPACSSPLLQSTNTAAGAAPLPAGRRRPRQLPRRSSPPAKGKSRSKGRSSPSTASPEASRPCCSTST